MRGQEEGRKGGRRRGAVPQRLPGSSPCHCVTSGRLAIKTDATKALAVLHRYDCVHRKVSYCGTFRLSLVFKMTGLDGSKKVKRRL